MCSSDLDEPKDGLGAGAIVAIVAGSIAGVALIGVGGFSVYWFAVKKKSFLDLKAIFSKK